MDVSLNQIANNASTSTTLWGVDWTLLCNQLSKSSSIRIVPCAFSEVTDFFAENASELAPDLAPTSEFLWNETSAAKNTFYSKLADCFMLRTYDTDRVIGIVICHPTDWNTYYLRYVVLLPAFRGQGRYGTFLNWLLNTLESTTPANRLEIEVSPSNQPHLGLLNKLGFKHTGIKLSERWGTLLHLTFFLRAKNEAVFHKQFCFGQIHGKEKRK